MSKSLLEQLRAVTVVVADTGDMQAMERFKPQDSTTNPSLITAAAQMPQYQSIVDDVLLQAKKELGPNAKDSDIATHAFESLAVEFGKKILAIVPGRVSTEVDARLSYDKEGTIAKAHWIISQYDKAGISRDRVLIKIASTWEGIKAAEVLEKEGIHCNLTLLFGLHQAIACAEAGVTLISPFVGRILDWYKGKTGKDYSAAEDPGVLSVKEIYAYYKKFGYATEVMGASFRNKGEILELAGCDLLTISPQLLGELQASSDSVQKKLSPETARNADLKQIHLDEKSFRWMFNENAMAVEKTAEGIRQFNADATKLDQFIAAQL